MDINVQLRAQAWLPWHQQKVEIPSSIAQLYNAELHQCITLVEQAYLGWTTWFKPTYSDCKEK